MRPWIGIALLGVSWLLGLDYYETASPWAQAVVLILGAWMLAAGERANPFRATREAYPELTVAILLLLLPVVWWTPWPYRLSPLAIIAGLVLERVPFARRLLRPAAAAWVAGGVILLAQAVALTLYAAVTARSHDLPGVLVKLLAGLCSLAGIDAAGRWADAGRAVDAAVASPGHLVGHGLRSGHADVPRGRPGMDHDRRRPAEFDPPALGRMGLDAWPASRSSWPPGCRSARSCCLALYLHRGG